MKGDARGRRVHWRRAARRRLPLTVVAQPPRGRVHEQDHRALAEKLLGQKLGDDIGGIVVERVRKDGTVIEGEAAREAERQRAAVKQGG
jgi:hypothetical protein